MWGGAVEDDVHTGWGGRAQGAKMWAVTLYTDDAGKNPKKRSKKPDGEWGEKKCRNRQRNIGNSRSKSPVLKEKGNKKRQKNKGKVKQITNAKGTVGQLEAPAHLDRGGMGGRE